MNQKLKSYLLIVCHLIIGLAVLIVPQNLTFPAWMNFHVLLLLTFICLSLLYVRIFHLKSEVREFWSLKKVFYLPIGIVFGGLIVLSPTIIGVITGQVSLNKVSIDAEQSISSILITLVIVSWEELWFRGIFLNYCNRYLSAINLSLIIGLLFMIMHVLNPRIDLLQAGPTLFFAGALLTILYFYFKTIWLPIGVHFGNNYLGSAMHGEFKTHPLFGNEGYVGAILLAILFFIFVRFTLRHNLTLKTKET